MARKRMIDPGIWDSEQAMSLSPDQFKLYVYLISQADDEGRLKNSPTIFKSRVHSMDDHYPTKKFMEDLWAVVACGLVKSYEGRTYLCHPNWKTYQKIDRPQPSKYPAPRTFDEDSTNTRRTLDERSIPMEVNRIEVKGIEEGALPPVANPAIPYKEILADLNTVCGTGFRDKTASWRDMIKARFNEGATPEDFQLVHRNRFREWKGDPKMVQYLTPATLYRPGNFAKYLEAAQRMKKFVEAQGAASPGAPACPTCGPGTLLTPYDEQSWGCHKCKHFYRRDTLVQEDIEPVLAEGGVA